LAFSPDGRHLLSSSSDGVKLWDIARRQISPNRIPQFRGDVREAAFGPDGATAAAITRDQGVVIWDINSGQVLSANRSIGGELATAFAFHPDGKSWLFGTSKSVTLYDSNTQKMQHEWKHPQALAQRTSSLRVSASGDTLVIKGSLDAPRVVDLMQHKELGLFRTLLAQSNATEAVTPVTSLSDSAFALGPDGRLFAQSFPDGAIVLWNLRQRRSLGEFFDSGRPDVVSKLFGQLGLQTKTSDVVVWDTEHRRPSGEPLRTPQADTTALAFSPNSQVLATGRRDGSIVFWDINTRRSVGQPLPSSGRAVHNLVFSPDGKLLAGLVSDFDANVPNTGVRISNVAAGVLSTGVGDVTLWDVATRQAIDRPFGEHTRSDMLSFSPDGRHLMSAGGGKIRLYDVKQRKVEVELSHGEGLLDAQAGAVFSVDGRQVFSLSRTSLTMWDVASRRRVDEPVRTLATPGTRVRLSPGGKLLGLLSADGLRLFDAATRQPLGDVFDSRGMSAQAYANANFSPDGKQFVVGGVFSPDGKWLASLATPYIWHIDIEKWLAQACKMVNRNLNVAEWQRYAGTDVSYVTACPGLPGVPGP
jgi:WD40 repeat protein